MECRPHAIISDVFIIFFYNNLLPDKTSLIYLSSDVKNVLVARFTNYVEELWKMKKSAYSLQMKILFITVENFIQRKQKI